MISKIAQDPCFPLHLVPTQLWQVITIFRALLKPYHWLQSFQHLVFYGLFRFPVGPNLMTSSVSSPLLQPCLWPWVHCEPQISTPAFSPGLNPIEYILDPQVRVLGMVHLGQCIVHLSDFLEGGIHLTYSSHSQTQYGVQKTAIRPQNSVLFMMCLETPVSWDNLGNCTSEIPWSYGCGEIPAIGG